MKEKQNILFAFIFLVIANLACMGPEPSEPDYQYEPPANNNPGAGQGSEIVTQESFNNSSNGLTENDLKQEMYLGLGGGGISDNLSGHLDIYPSCVSAGEQITVTGTDFWPNTNLPFGVYYTVEYNVQLEPNSSLVNRTELVFSMTVTTDSSGNFSILLTTEPSDAPGDYEAFVLLVPGSDGFFGSGRRSPFCIR